MRDERMRTHHAMKADRATARRQLRSLRGSTAVGIRHELTSVDLLETHRRFVADEMDDEE
jgi:hypothetical protein